MSGKRILVVAWSAADWGLIHQAIDREELPHLASLVEGGVSGPLTSLAPLSVPIVSTSLATGFHPPHHGVLGELELRPDGGGVRPIGKRSWRVPALWEVLARAGRRTAVVNWPATRPGDRWPGIVVDERFAVAEGQSFETWPLPPHCVAPENLRDGMRDLRVHPRDISSAQLAGLVSRLPDVDTRSDRRPGRLAASLARSATTHAAATHIAQHEEWEFLLVRYTLIADVWHDLGTGTDAAGIYRDAVLGSHRLLDLMLGRLLELAGPETTVFVLAAAGWRSAGASINDSADQSATAFDKGMLVARGPGLKRDALFYRATAVDLAPTVLACFGLSAPSDGAALDSIFEEGLPDTEAVPPPLAVSPAGSDNPEAHLLALGYIDQPSDAAMEARAAAELGHLRNLADSFLALHQWDAARAVLKQILARAPGDYLAHLKSGRTLLLMGDAQGALVHAKAAMSAEPELPWCDLLMGSAYAATGDTVLAEPHLARAYKLGSNLPGVNLSLGWAAVLLQHWREAENAFRTVLGLNATVAEAHTGLGVSLHAQGQFDDAEAELRRAIALFYDSPIAHFHLGQILLRRGAVNDAAASLRVALGLNQNLEEARLMLARINKMEVAGPGDAFRPH